MSNRKPWKKHFGAYGSRVTVFESKAGGLLWVRWYDASMPNGEKKGNWRKKSLKHRDRKAGEIYARDLSAKLQSSDRRLMPLRITLGALLSRYYNEVSIHKKGGQSREDARRIRLWSDFLGNSRFVDAIDRSTIDQFVRARRGGSLRIRGVALRAVSDSTIGSDLIFLNSVFNWELKVRSMDSRPLIAANPLVGYARPKNKNPKRPIATYSRFLMIQKAAISTGQPLFSPFLQLVESLGWRVSAVCELRASDLRLERTDAAPYGTVLKREEVDKEGVEMWVPLSHSARTAIDAILTLHLPIGKTPLFPAPRRPDKPWTRYYARDLLRKAERAAGLEPLNGGGFHPYRRKWATERKHLPLADVAAAGGWRDVRSLQDCYQLADTATVFKVVSEPTKLEIA